VLAAIGLADYPAGVDVRRNTPKRASDEARYLKARKSWLEGKCCARCGTSEGLTVQHMAGRDGWRLLYEPWWLPLCWVPCHSWVEQHPDEAKEQGFALPKTWSSE
jgi:hypothetical protein